MEQNWLREEQSRPIQVYDAEESVKSSSITSILSLMLTGRENPTVRGP
ncbi:hypothetical protein [Lederbergia graminis]